MIASPRSSHHSRPSRTGVVGRRARAAAALVAVGAIAESWRHATAGHDDNVLDGLADAIRRPRGTVVDWVVAATTDIGSVFGLAGMAATVGRGINIPTGVGVAGAGTVGWVLGQAVKPLAQRQRPYETGLAALLVHPPAGSSWPSGHTAVAVATATVLARRGPRTAAFAVALAGWVGVTRVYVGAHHPTDVVGGAGIGVLSGLLWQLAEDGWHARHGANA